MSMYQFPDPNHAYQLHQANAGYTSPSGDSSSSAPRQTSVTIAEPSSGKSKKQDKVAIALGPSYKEGPVKAACLTCRGKKAKCDGAQPVCGACAKKDLQCTYVKSRRGGARKKREVPPPSALQEFLKKLDGLVGLPDFKVEVGVREPTDDTTNIVREFSSTEEILRCYYNEVHPFLPVMPARQFLDQIVPTLLPVSPFLLAVQTILVLVPHSQDRNPKSSTSKRLRSAASHAFAQQATDAVSRLVDHGQTSLECVQAMTILALWEWGSSGSTSKNRARSTHATQLAMEIGLHDMDKYSPDQSDRVTEGEDWQKDMARRTWWMTYVNQLISAIVTGTTPVMSADDDRIHVHFPVCSVDDESWPRWIEANRMCTRIFGVVNTVYYSHLMPGGSTAWGSRVEGASGEVKERMRKEIYAVDAQVTEMMKKAEEMAVIELVPGGEEEVVRNQQLSARLGLAVVHIHIHRQQAFPEVSLFSKKICGLPKMPDFMMDSSGAITMNDNASSSASHGVPEYASSGNPSPSSGGDETDNSYDFIDDMWQPDAYPESLPQPWFAHAGGAGALYQPVTTSPTFHPAVSASITSYHSPTEAERRNPVVCANSNKPHRAWGVDANDKPEKESVVPGSEATNLFPPGVSLARCATAAHAIVRLEVLHRSAVIAMWDGPPKWMPFCACGLVTGAYSFLLLALAVQAESAYRIPSDQALEQIDGLLTNVKVIVAGLEAYGTMWAGIEVMAAEVRAALDAATRLPGEIRAQIAASESSVPSSDGFEYDFTGTNGGTYIEKSPSTVSYQSYENQSYPVYPAVGQAYNGLGVLDDSLVKSSGVSPVASIPSDNGFSSNGQDYELAPSNGVQNGNGHIGDGLNGQNGFAGQNGNGFGQPPGRGHYGWA